MELERIAEQRIDQELENDDTKKESMSSQEYLEAMNQLQEKYKVFEAENKINKNRYRIVVKEMCEIFGLVETLGTMFQDAVDGPPEVYMLFECISSKVNRMMDDHIL